MKAIILILVSNFLIFIPYSIINLFQKKQAFTTTQIEKININNVLKLFYARSNSDFLRFSFDFLLLIFIILIFKIDSIIALILMTCIWVSSLIEVTYSNIMTFQFQRAPLLYSDLDFMKAGWRISKNKKGLIIFSLLIIVCFCFVLGYILSKYIIKYSIGKIEIIIFIGFLLLISLYHLFSYVYEYYYERTFISPIWRFYQNIKNCIKYDISSSLTIDRLIELNQYKEDELREKPNLWFINVESYGSVLYYDEEINKEVFEALSLFEKSIKAKEWRIASIISEAPIFGGASWLSMASIFYGIRMDNGILYNSLFRSSDKFEKYESILHFLKRNKYYGSVLCPLSGGYQKYVEWDVLKKVYRNDQFIDEDTLNFKGNFYKFMENGYSPPDQYSINFAEERLKSYQPYFVVYPTLNSHFPWDSPVEIVEDWKNLNDKESVLQDNRATNEIKVKYIQAMKYQLSFLSDFIGKHKENSIFILFGDHQPPFITDTKYGSYTPIHIISKNQAFIAGFLKNNFVDELNKLKENVIKIKHEALFSIFMISFLNYFGINGKKDYIIHHNGLIFD